MRELIEFIRRNFVGIRSRNYVFYYSHFWGIKFGRRVRIYSKFLIMGPGDITIGEDTVFGSRIYTNVLATTYPNSTIHIGNNCFLNGCAIAAASSITIGDNCIISDANIMDTSSHGIAPNRRRDPAEAKVAPIVLSDNVWIGSQAYVMPGVTIGKNSIVGVNSVVTKSLPENVFAAGVPAKIIHVLEDAHD